MASTRVFPFWLAPDRFVSAPCFPARVFPAWVASAEVASARAAPAWVASARVFPSQVFLLEVFLLEFYLLEFNLSYCSRVVVNFQQKSWFNSYGVESSCSSRIQLFNFFFVLETCIRLNCSWHRLSLQLQFYEHFEHQI